MLISCKKKSVPTCSQNVLYIFVEQFWTIDGWSKKIYDYVYKKANICKRRCIKLCADKYHGKCFGGKEKYNTRSSDSNIEIDWNSKYLHKPIFRVFLLV